MQPDVGLRHYTARVLDEGLPGGAAPHEPQGTATAVLDPRSMSDFDLYHISRLADTPGGRLLRKRLEQGLDSLKTALTMDPNQWAAGYINGIQTVCDILDHAVTEQTQRTEAQRGDRGNA